MIELKKMFFTNSQAFRDWLEIYHDKSPGIWLVIYKKHTKKESIQHPEALDEALCYGWIDSIIKRLDEETYAIKFTPRSNTSQWSDVNMRRVDELIKNGKMTEAGLRKIDSYIQTGQVAWEPCEKKRIKPEETGIPGFIAEGLAGNEPAWTNFNLLAPSHKGQYVGWIMDAKREATRMARLEETIRLLKENKKLGLK